MNVKFIILAVLMELVFGIFFVYSWFFGHPNGRLASLILLVGGVIVICINVMRNHNT